VIDSDGWFHTGDKVRIENNHIYITGRLKEIIVLATGEKVPPADMEMAITLDPLFEQVMVIGDNHPFLSMVMVLEPDQWKTLAHSLNLDPDNPESLANEAVEKAVCARLTGLLKGFPGHAQIYRVTCTLEPWTVDNDLMTPTLKLKRDRILAHFAAAVDRMYAGH